MQHKSRNKILKATKYSSATVCKLNSKNLLHRPIDASWTDYTNIRYTLTSILSEDDKIGNVLDADTSGQQSSSVRSAFLRVGNRCDVDANGTFGYGFAGEKNIDGMQTRHW